MSLKTKKKFKNLGKIVGIALFALLTFTNIKIALSDDGDIPSSEISLLGVELTLFEATYASGGGGCTMEFETVSCDGAWGYCCAYECGGYSGVLDGGPCW